MAYHWRGEEVVIAGPVKVALFLEYAEGGSKFDGLREGDVFGHMDVRLRLTSSILPPSIPYTMAGSYTFTLNEEWGGESFLGTFEGSKTPVIIY